jgi:hypothetical protein
MFSLVVSCKYVYCIWLYSMCELYIYTMCIFVKILPIWESHMNRKSLAEWKNCVSCLFFNNLRRAKQMLHPSSSIIWTSRCPHLLSKKRRVKQLSLVTSPMFLGAFSRSLVNWLGRLPFFCQLPLGGRTWGPSNLYFHVKLNVIELWENFENFEAA